MKFLALMKDSLREAVDTWVLYITLIMSGLLILVVACVSYRPITVQEEVQQIPDQFNLVLGLVAPGAGASARIADFKQTNDAPASQPWKGDYNFSLIFHMPTEDQTKKLAKQLPVGKMQDTMSKALYWADFVDVDMDTMSDPLEVRYIVVTRGSTITNIREWVHEPTFFFFVPIPIHGSLNSWVYSFEDRLLNGPGSWACILVGVLLTSFFVPNMLRKGTIDMLLVKPMHRVTLLLWKYVGGLLFVFINSLVAVGSIWLITGFRTGIWAPGVLVLIPGITFYFGILYAVSVLFGVLTRGPIMSILITFAVWLVLWGVGWAYQDLTLSRKGGTLAPIPFGLIYSSGSETFKTAVDVAYTVLPRTKDIDVLMTMVIAGNLMSEADYKHEDFDKLPDPNWWVSLPVTLGFIAVMLGLACWRFAVKDY
jgi:ABC-type transport system involved in multi-copper enzyme maturation permease subunit